MSDKYSNFNEQRAKLMNEIQGICKKFNISGQILNPRSKIKHHFTATFEGGEDEELTGETTKVYFKPKPKE